MGFFWLYVLLFGWGLGGVLVVWGLFSNVGTHNDVLN